MEELNTIPTTPVSTRSRMKQVFYIVSAILLLLAMLSYNVEDADYLAGGTGDSVPVIQNLIGRLGAFVSRQLLIFFGFGAYVCSVLYLLFALRRLFGGFKRKPTWDYGISFCLTVISASMLLAINPDFMQEKAEVLNISQLPGGVLGQRLCAPGSGWLQAILNPTGSAIIAGVLLLTSLVVLWIYDWHNVVIPATKSFFTFIFTPNADDLTDTGSDDKRRTIDELRRQQSSEEEEPRPKAKRKKKKPEPEPSSQDMLPFGEDEPAFTSSEEPVIAPQTFTAPKPNPGKAPKVKAPSGGPFTLPDLLLLNPPPERPSTVPQKEINFKKEILQATLDSFGIDAKVGEATSGPRVTLFEVMPAPGVKVERISQISNNIAMELCAVSLRILTPIPGRNSVGIEVPNTTATTVTIRSLMEDPSWKSSKAQIPVLLGRDIEGKTVVLDLARAPHLLIAGATGSGKSVCINAVIISLLFKFKPEEMQLIMVDPKVVEFSCYNTLPHLVVPVITDVKKVPLALRWVINEMERRYRVLAKVGVRNLQSFNERKAENLPVLDDDGNPIPAKLPFIIVVIDELADIMMTAKADVETSLARIAQLSRAVGIHTIVATQRPSVNVITGTIKANYPTRIAFQVTSQVDSRTILDCKGADNLLGRGDMLYRPPGASGLYRNQGPMVDDDEIDRAVEFVSAQAEQEFNEDVFKSADSVSDGGDPTSPGGGGVSDEDEDLIRQATEVILRDRRATTSYVQRCLRIGYNRAAMIIEILEQRGVIGPQVGTQPRDILIDNGSSEED